MLPLELFRSRVFSASAFVGAAINFGFYGQLFVISLYFQQVRGYSALATGLAMLPEGLFVSVASAFAGRLTARVGPRVPMLTGLTTGGLGLVGLVVAGPHTPYPVLIAPLAAAGFGIAVTMPAATAAIIEAAPAHHAGIAAGVLNASRQAGGDARRGGAGNPDRRRLVHRRPAGGDGGRGRGVLRGRRGGRGRRPAPACGGPSA